MDVSEILHPGSAAAPATITHSGRTYVLTDREALLAHIATARTPAAAPAALVPHTLPATVSLAQYQTPIKDQKDRGTCWAFAGAAAVEAAYKRQYGVTLDLSEQYIAHMAKVQELAYDTMSPGRTHENNSTLWDGQGASDIIRKMSQSAVPPEASAPYMTQSQLVAIQNEVAGGTGITIANGNPLQSVMDAFELRPELIPPASRTACQYLVTAWSDPGKYDSATLEGVLAGGHEVVVDIVLDWAEDANGIYQYSATTKGAGHCVVLIGYDHAGQYFLCKNSWGGTAWFKLGYGFIDHCCSWAHVVTKVADPEMVAQKRAFWGGVWNMDTDGWRGTLDFRRTINYRAADINAPTRLGTYTRDGVQYDVNGSFSENGQGCTFYIASDADRVQPGTLSGQRFDLYCFSWDINHAAGYTRNGGALYGALLSRAPLPAEKSGKFVANNWVGTYAMSHDGWPATLHIASAAPFIATYTDAKGRQYPVKGTVQDHTLRMTVAFTADAPQAFELLYHTWEIGVFSGTTSQGGVTYGVIGLPPG